MGSGWSNSSTIRLTEVGGAPAVTARDSLEVEIAGGLRQPFVAGRLFNDVGVASNFTLTISGTEDEVLEVAVQHAVTAHGHKNTPELRNQIRSMLKDERAS